MAGRTGPEAIDSEYILKVKNAGSSDRSDASCRGKAPIFGYSKEEVTAAIIKMGKISVEKVQGKLYKSTCGRFGVSTGHLSGEGH